MKKKYFSKITILLIFLNLYHFNAGAQGKSSTKDYLVQITTSLGKVYLVLYEDTPKHRENFLRLIKKKFYKNLLFHRVIKDYMIQGGDPTSKFAPKGKLLGRGGFDMGYIGAEFRSNHIHKRGALAAAHDGNPSKASSACQFYIVIGKKIKDKDLSIMEQRIQQKYTPEQRKVYKEQGGVPPLDQNYTVFGEVVKGMNIVEKIGNQPTDASERPYVDIIIKDILIRKMKKTKIAKKFGYSYN